MRQKAEAEMHPEAMERAGYWFRDASVPAPEPEAPSGPRSPSLSLPHPPRRRHPLLAPNPRSKPSPRPSSTR